MDTSFLHAYRHAHRLSTPSAFQSSLNQMILSNPNGLGPRSPTMVRPRDRRRVSHEQLALAVRKHFNGQAVQEGDVVVDFLYKVRWQRESSALLFPRPRYPRDGSIDDVSLSLSLSLSLSRSLRLRTHPVASYSDHHRRQGLSGPIRAQGDPMIPSFDPLVEISSSWFGSGLGITGRGW